VPAREDAGPAGHWAPFEGLTILLVTMKRAAVPAALAAGMVLVFAFGIRPLGHRASAATRARGGPVVLTALPSIGTIYWRSRCAGRGPSRWSLGIRLWSSTATTGVRFKAGKLVTVRTLQPGDPTSWFPYSGKRVQYLAAASGGEEGTVVGVVRMNYGYPSREPLCFTYAPPRATVQIYPRRYYNSRDFLRRFTR
jgi:hypothetical protein